MSGVTVFFNVGKERTWTDGDDVIYTTTVTEETLHVHETLRLIPGGQDNWKKPRTVNIYPRGIWREVEFCYER